MMGPARAVDKVRRRVALDTVVSQLAVPSERRDRPRFILPMPIGKRGKGAVHDHARSVQQFLSHPACRRSSRQKKKTGVEETRVATRPVSKAEPSSTNVRSEHSARALEDLVIADRFQQRLPLAGQRGIWVPTQQSDELGDFASTQVALSTSAEKHDRPIERHALGGNDGGRARWTMRHDSSLGERRAGFQGQRRRGRVVAAAQPLRAAVRSRFVSGVESPKRSAGRQKQFDDRPFNAPDRAILRVKSAIFGARTLARLEFLAVVRLNRRRTPIGGASTPG